MSRPAAGTPISASQVGAAISQVLQTTGLSPRALAEATGIPCQRSPPSSPASRTRKCRK